MVFRPKFTSDGSPSDEFSVLDGNPSSNRDWAFMFD